MSTTARDIFDKAIYLMGENNDNTGATDTGDTKEYLVRTLGILNVLRNECFPYSDTYRTGEPGKRPVCPAIASLEDEVFLDDGLAQGVMPYGLAARLIADENPTLASFFQQCYAELLARYGRGVPTGSEAIVDVYGGGHLPYNDFGAWT